LLAGLLLCGSKTEPSYQGKTLSEWLVDLNYSYRPSDLAARQAIKTMGTNILPHVLPMLRKKDWLLEEWLLRQLKKQSITRISWTPARVVRNRAACAIRALRSDGRVAETELLTMLDRPTDAWVAMTVFCDMGSNGMRGLIKALTNQQA